MTTTPGQAKMAAMTDRLRLDRSKKTEDLVDDLVTAYETLADGKWDKHDLRAIITIAGALAGLASAAFLALQQAGAL